MRNIKDRGLLASVKMRSQDTHARVLYRHSIASKRNHFTTMLHVKVIESSSLGRLKEGGSGCSEGVTCKDVWDKCESPVELFEKLTSAADANERFAKFSMAGFLINFVANIVWKEEEKGKWCCSIVWEGFYIFFCLTRWSRASSVATALTAPPSIANQLVARHSVKGHRSNVMRNV